MPLSSALAPGFVRQTYSGFTLPHHLVMPINFATPPTPGVEPDLQPTGGGAVPWITAWTGFLTAFLQSFNNSTKFGLADIFSVDATTGIRTFIYTHDFAMNGFDLVSPNVESVQGVWNFKTSVGKPLKLYAMEGVYAADARNVGSVPPGPRQDVIDYILSPDNIAYGRRNAYPLAFASFVSKENDVLRRRQGFSDV